MHAQGPGSMTGKNTRQLAQRKQPEAIEVLRDGDGSPGDGSFLVCTQLLSLHSMNFWICKWCNMSDKKRLFGGRGAALTVGDRSLEETTR